MLLSTSESLGITVTPRTFLIQSENMGDRELLCENLWFSTESRSENSAEWAVLLGPSLLKPKLKLFASTNIVTFIPSKKWSDIRTSYTYSTVRNTL